MERAESWPVAFESFTWTFAAELGEGVRAAEQREGNEKIKKRKSAAGGVASIPDCQVSIPDCPIAEVRSSSY